MASEDAFVMTEKEVIEEIQSLEAQAREYGQLANEYSGAAKYLRGLIVRRRQAQAEDQAVDESSEDVAE